jgi:hypothetical protein
MYLAFHRAFTEHCVHQMFSSSPSHPLLSTIPRSAKKWARSAHLHEVKGAANNAVITPLGLSAFEPPSQDNGAALLEDDDDKENVFTSYQKGKNRLVSGAMSVASASSCISVPGDGVEEGWVTDSASSVGGGGEGDESEEEQESV